MLTRVTNEIYLLPKKLSLQARTQSALFSVPLRYYVELIKRDLHQNDDVSGASASPQAQSSEHLSLGYHNNNRKVSPDSFVLMRHLTERSSFIKIVRRAIKMSIWLRRRPLSMICGGAIKRGRQNATT